MDCFAKYLLGTSAISVSDSTKMFLVSRYEMDGLSEFGLRNLVEARYHVLELFIFSFSVADNFSVCVF